MAFKSLTNSKGRVLTRIISLAMGLTLGVFLLSYVNYRYHFDNFLPDNERIYKIFLNIAKDGGGVDQLTHAPLAHSLMKDCPEVQAGTRIYGSMTFAWADQEAKEHELTIYSVDTLFFDVLDFGLIRGKVSDLNDFGNIFISEEAAKRIFGDEDPIGKTLKDNLDYPKRVAGIFRQPPHNTSLGFFDALVSEKQHQVNYNMESSWDGTNEYYSYIKLYPGSSAASVEQWMNSAMLDKYGLREVSQKYQSKFFLVPVIRAEITVGTRQQYMDFIAIITILVLILCALNYALLSISSLVNRSRTIAVMRCTAADKRDIWIQFMWETLFVMLIAGVIAVISLYLMQDTLSAAIELPIINLFESQNLWVTILVVLTLFLGSGMIPATLFANIPTAVAFRGITDKKKGWKQALLVFEVVCVSFAFAFLLVSVRQIKLMQDGQLGYNPKNLMYVSLLVHGGDELYNTERSFESLPCVDRAGTSWSLPCYGYLPKNPFFDENSAEVTFPFVKEGVSSSYFDVMQIPLLDGKIFTENSPFDEVVVNSKFLEMAGMLDSPLGRIVCQADNEGNIVSRYRIIGVVDNIRSTESGRFQPMVFTNLRAILEHEEWSYGGFRTMIRLSDMSQQNIDAVLEKYHSYLSINKYQYDIYENTFNNKMKGELHFRSILLIVACLAAIIAAIGLVGYVGDELKRRQKEISIRKLCGASLSSILWLMICDFSILAVPAIVVGEILAVIASREWLQMFDYRLPLDCWMFISTGLIVLLAIYLAQILLTLRIANTNPATTLKTE
ncbi:MAG: ABC transporter permease [Bacteroidia bacterium]|nr:ABC transporter permease [Bacteroidia bacterium]